MTKTVLAQLAQNAVCVYLDVNLGDTTQIVATAHRDL